MTIKQYLFRNEINIKGWTTKRKIIIFESDDWGSIRMPSKDVYHILLKSGINVDKCPYNSNDSLASEDDLSALFDVLASFKDMSGNHPVITANTVVANPDFDKIRESGYTEYFYEPFTDTLKRYPSHENSFKLWKEGMESKVFSPQFHGREHVNVNLWLELLRNNHPQFRKAFDLHLWGLGPAISNTGSKINIQAAFDYISDEELENQKNVINDGVELFQKIIGCKPKCFIANNFIWDSRLNPVFKRNGVDVLQGMKYQKKPIGSSAKRELIRHFTGEQNEFGQVYLVRNCSFEPTQYPKIDSINSCLMDISNAFFWRKPAIINSHRLNYIGFINEENRNRNLSSLKQLLERIIKRWPDVEFMTSQSLGQLILNQKTI